MEQVIGGYRDAALPAPAQFPLRMGTGALVSVWATVGTMAFSVLLLLMTGELFFLLCVAAIGPGVVYLYAGVPHRIEVSHREAVVRSWMRVTMRLPTAGLSVRHGGVEVVLESREGRVIIASEQFPNDSLEACVYALGESGARVIDERRRATAR